MKTTRRNFLKGLMALTGAAVLGLPDIEWVEAIEPEILELSQVAERPRGRLGSLRIDDKWYALHDADIAIDHEPIYAFDGGKQIVVSRVIAGWTIDCDLGTPLDDTGGALYAIEIDAGGRQFLAEGYLSGYGTTLIPAIDPEMYFPVTLEGVGAITRL